MEDKNKEKEADITNNENIDDLDNLSINQINELFYDIIEVPEEYFLAYAATGKGCHNPPRC